MKNHQLVDTTNSKSASLYIVIYEMFLGIVEFILGGGMLIFGSQFLTFYQTTIKHEIAEDPYDILIRFTQNTIPDLIAKNHQFAVYIILLGVVKIVGSIGLLYGKTWGLDLLLFLIILSLPFQVYHLLLHFSFIEMFFVIIEALLIAYLTKFKPINWMGLKHNSVNRDVNV